MTALLAKAVGVALASHPKLFACETGEGLDMEFGKDLGEFAATNFLVGKTSSRELVHLARGGSHLCTGEWRRREGVTIAIKDGYPQHRMCMGGFSAW